MRLNNVKPLRCKGRVVIEVRRVENDEGMREVLGPCDYMAQILGWHRGQCPGLGDSAKAAISQLASYCGETLESIRSQCFVSFIGCDPLPGFASPNWSET